VIQIGEFEPRLALDRPETHELLRSAKLAVHPAVRRIVLHGSRGLAGGWRADSDIDLSLVVEDPSAGEAPLSLLRAVYRATLDSWQSSVELDLAVIFDRRSCGLACFAVDAWDPALCPHAGLDCFGLYKLQKGFDGLVTGAGVQVRLMYPCLTIWRRG
jgi:predicted nucleotidyltransferase